MEFKSTKQMIIFLVVLTVLMIVTSLTMKASMNQMTYGVFTIDSKEAKSQYTQALDCEWGWDEMMGFPSCSPAPCKTYNIDGYQCVREGYTSTGFLGFTNFNTVYYVCEDLGRVARSCAEYYHTQKDFFKDMGYGE